MHDVRVPEDGPLLKSEYDFIALKARQVIGRYGYTETDRDDLFQILVLHLLRAIRRFDPTQGDRKAFVVSVVENRLASLIREQCTDKRCGVPIPPSALRASFIGSSGNDPSGKARPRRRFTESLDVTAVDEELGRCAIVRQDNLDNRRLSYPGDPQDSLELELDMKQVLSGLPAEERAVAEGVMESGSVSEYARVSGTPRRTVRDRVAKLRQQLEKHDMHR